MKIELNGKRVLVIGGGVSGIGAVKLLLEIGALPVLFDSNENLDEAVIRKQLAAVKKALLSDQEECVVGCAGEVSVEIVLGELKEEVLERVDVAVVSPGISLDAEPVARVRRRDIPIVGEIELGFWYGRGRVIAITGTNGKTTTVTLVGEIMKAYYESVYVVGNIGRPYTEIALETTDESIVVAEISSFQLETIGEFVPKVSAVLNVTPDHLDRHKTMEHYVQIKERITENQNQDHVCVLNYENEHTRAFGERCPAKVVWFSSEQKPEEGYYLDGEAIYISENGCNERLLDISEMQMVGICNVENVMAAMAVSRSIGIPMKTILDVVRAFRGVEHRIEYVASREGVAYYNDSKGTNPDAAIQGIKAMSRPTVLLAGGYDKKGEYDEWMEAARHKVKALVLVGETKEKIARCAMEHGIKEIFLAATFQEALDTCREQARAGEAVLLSPACASWGMFPNYEVRGNCFKEYVLAIRE